MVPNAVIEQMSPDSLWIGSQKIIWDCTPVGSSTGVPIWILLSAALFLCIATSRYIFSYLSDKIPLTFQPMRYQAPLSIQFMAALLSITIFSCFLLSGSLCFLSLADKDSFLLISISILLFISVKAAILLLTQKASGARCLMSCLRAMMVLISVIAATTAFFSLTALLIPEITHTKFFMPTLAGMVILAALLYFYKVLRTLFSSGISPFYTFLYLCTLEFIPLSLITVMFTRL